MDKNTFWIVIPAYNEEKLILHTLNALCAQTDKDFVVVVVDNNSNDKTRSILDAYKKTKKLNLHIISELQKGTGAASDTGFKYAITHGAQYIARTDSDALPASDWVAVLKKGFSSGLLFIGGRIAPRTDEESYRWYDGIFFNTIIRTFEFAPRLFFKRPEHKYPLFMAAGLNMAITAELYTQVGGFPRSAIDDTDEDLELHHKVCATIEGDQAKLMKDAKVYGSIRKGKAMGYLGIVLWYWNRKRKPVTVDVR